MLIALEYRARRECRRLPRFRASILYMPRHDASQDGLRIAAVKCLDGRAVSMRSLLLSYLFYCSSGPHLDDCRRGRPILVNGRLERRHLSVAPPSRMRALTIF